MKKALLVIDMLNDFVLPGAPLEVPETRRILPALKERIERARAEGVPVVYVCDAHAPDDPEFSTWPAHAVRGSKGAQVVSDLAPRQGEAVVEKSTLLGFYGTSLEEVLRSRKVEELVITGCVTNICVYFSSIEAVVRGFRVRVPADSVASLEEEEGNHALGQMEKVLGVSVER